MTSSILNFLSKPKKIVYTVKNNQEFSQFRWDSYQSGLYPYNSDDIYNAYIQARQNTTLMTGDTIELKWLLNDSTEAWMMFMILKGYDLKVK